jgi:hypothetical protein
MDQAIRHLAGHLEAQHDLDSEADVRIVVGEALDRFGDARIGVVDDPVLNADNKLAVRCLVDGRGALLEQLDGGEKVLGRLIDDLALAIQLEPFRTALAQARAQPDLQGFEVFAENGLGEVQRSLGGGKAALFDDRAEATQQLQVDVVDLAWT